LLKAIGYSLFHPAVVQVVQDYGAAGPEARNNKNSTNPACRGEASSEDWKILSIRKKSKRIHSFFIWNSGTCPAEQRDRQTPLWLGALCEKPFLNLLSYQSIPGIFEIPLDITQTDV
jgi:hypothetical protein